MATLLLMEFLDFFSYAPDKHHPAVVLSPIDRQLYCGSNKYILINARLIMSLHTIIYRFKIKYLELPLFISKTFAFGRNLERKKAPLSTIFKND